MRKGQRRQKTTKSKDRGRAIDMARMLERLAASGRGRTLTEAVARKAVSELVEQATGEAVQFHTCRTWLDEWLAGKRGAVADKSIEKYEQVVQDFLSHLGDLISRSQPSARRTFAGFATRLRKGRARRKKTAP